MWKLPSTPPTLTVQPTTGVISGGPLEDSHGDGNTFPGGGNDYHRSTQEQMDTLVHEAESSASLATAKPIYTENNTQSEVSDLLYPTENRALY